jgi:hypothetical protein
MQGTIHEVASPRCLELDLSLSGQNGLSRRRPEPPPAIPAAESALGLRPRIALSSAQVLPEWITSTSPHKDFSSNGDYPLNFSSHWKGSPQNRIYRFRAIHVGSTWDLDVRESPVQDIDAVVLLQSALEIRIS